MQNYCKDSGENVKGALKMVKETLIIKYQKFKCLFLLYE